MYAVLAGIAALIVVVLLAIAELQGWGRWP
jgi:hypothetical protein